MIYTLHSYENLYIMKFKELSAHHKSGDILYTPSVKTSALYKYLRTFCPYTRYNLVIFVLISLFTAGYNIILNN